jgi:hypothetical protein
MFQYVSIHLYVSIIRSSTYMGVGAGGCIQTYDQNGCGVWVPSGLGLESEVE